MASATPTPTPTLTPSLGPSSLEGDIYTNSVFSSLRLVTPVERFLDGHVTDIQMPPSFYMPANQSANARADIPQSAVPDAVSLTAPFIGMLYCKWDNCLGPVIEHLWRLAPPFDANLFEKSQFQAQPCTYQIGAPYLCPPLLTRAFGCTRDSAFLKKVAAMALTAHVEQNIEPTTLQKYVDKNLHALRDTGWANRPIVKHYHFPEMAVSLCAFIFRSQPYSEKRKISDQEPPDAFDPGSFLGSQTLPEEHSLFALCVLYHCAQEEKFGEFSNPDSRSIGENTIPNNNPSSSDLVEDPFASQVRIQSLLEGVIDWIVPFITKLQHKVDASLQGEYFEQLACILASLLNIPSKHSPVPQFHSTRRPEQPKREQSLSQVAFFLGLLRESYFNPSASHRKLLTDKAIFLSLALSSHLATSGRTLVLGWNARDVCLMFNTLALFLTLDELRNSCCYPVSFFNDVSATEPKPVSGARVGVRPDLAKDAETCARESVSSNASLGDAAQSKSGTSSPTLHSSSRESRSETGYGKEGSENPRGFTIGKCFDWRAFVRLAGIVLPIEQTLHPHSIWAYYARSGGKFDMLPLSFFLYSSPLPLTIIDVDQMLVFQSSKLSPEFQSRRARFRKMIENDIVGSGPIPSPPQDPYSMPQGYMNQYSHVPSQPIQSANLHQSVRPPVRPSITSLGSGPTLLGGAAISKFGVTIIASPEATQGIISGNVTSISQDTNIFSVSPLWDSLLLNLLSPQFTKEQALGGLMVHLNRPSPLVSQFLEQLMQLTATGPSDKEGGSYPVAQSPRRELGSDSEALVLLQWIDMFREDLENRARLFRLLILQPDEVPQRALSASESHAHRTSSGAQAGKGKTRAQKSFASTEAQIMREKLQANQQLLLQPDSSNQTLQTQLQELEAILESGEQELLFSTLVRLPDGLWLLS